MLLADEGKEESKSKSAAFWTALGGKGKPATAASAGADAQEETKPKPTLHQYYILHHLHY